MSVYCGKDILFKATSIKFQIFTGLSVESLDIDFVTKDVANIKLL